MTHWVTATEAAASNLEQIILKVVSRFLALREGYERDNNLNVIGRKFGTTTPSGPATTNWDIPRQMTDGRWAILSPASDARYGEPYTDQPAVLAVGWGIDPATVGWAAVITAANSAGASLSPIAFDPTVEVTMPRIAWIFGAAAAIGIVFVEVESPDFPDSGTSPD